MFTIKSLPFFGLIVAIIVFTPSAIGQIIEEIPTVGTRSQQCENTCKPLGALCHLFNGMCNNGTLQYKVVPIEKFAFRSNSETIGLPILKPSSFAPFTHPIPFSNPETVDSIEVLSDEPVRCDPGFDNISRIKSTAFEPIGKSIQTEQDMRKNQLIFIHSDERTALRPIEIPERSMFYPAPLF